MYVIVWKYNVNPENRDTFEKEYNSEGSWAQFFRTSEYFRGTCLFKCENDADSYLLLDFWHSKEGYDYFQSAHAHTYQELSLQFRKLYQEEIKVDAYFAIH